MFRDQLKTPIALVYLCIGALGIMYAAFYNGYPLVTSDTNTYIRSGFDFTIPADRPPFYGIFIRISSLWTSLWFTVFVQSAILTTLLYRLSHRVYGNDAPFHQYVTGFITIISFTCISWISSYLMADIFAAILLLATVLYLFEEKAVLKIVYLIVAAYAILTHNSHFIIALIFPVYLLIVAGIKRSKKLALKGAALFVTAAMCFILLSCVNLYNGNGFTMSKSSHIFMMGKLAETGILNTYLDDNCPTKKLVMCNYKDDIPILAFEYLWASNSPLYKTGGWDNSKPGYDSIIHDVFTQPKYVKMFLIKSIISTARQMTQVNIPDKPMVQDMNSGVYGAVHKYFQDEEKEYLCSKQNQNNLDLHALNIIYGLFLALSSFFAVWYLPQVADNKQITDIYTAFIVLIILNAFATATFANVLDRLQNRVFWLLPALNAMLMVKYLYEKKDAVGK